MRRDRLMVIHDERMTLGEVILTTMFNCFGDPFL